MLGSELLRYNKNQEYFIFDKETESLNLYAARPWEVAWLMGKLDTITEENDYFPWFPDLKVTIGAARVTRFDFAEYKAKAIDPYEVLARFEKKFLDPEVIKGGHNVYGYDNFIYISFRRALSLPINYDFIYNNVILDTNNIAKAWKKGFKIPPIRSKEFVTFNYKMSAFHEKGLKTSLTTLGKELKIDFDYESTHRGVNDIILNKLVLDKLIWLVEI